MSRPLSITAIISPLDVDECSAVAGVCDVNANCQNTAGSYICSCNAGFTGDGKTCNGKSVIPRYRSDKQRNYEVHFL